MVGADAVRGGDSYQRWVMTCGTQVSVGWRGWGGTDSVLSRVGPWAPSVAGPIWSPWPLFYFFVLFSFSFYDLPVFYYFCNKVSNEFKSTSKISKIHSKISYQ
jgi:hypothetical protein